LIFLHFCIPRSVHHLILPSFPTRRSSDLEICLECFHGGLRSTPASGLTFREGIGSSAGNTKAVKYGRCIGVRPSAGERLAQGRLDRKSTRLNSSHVSISYAVFCLKKKKKS